MTRPRVVLLRGHSANPWELGAWELLRNRFDVVVGVTGRNLFDVSGLGLERAEARTRRARTGSRKRSRCGIVSQTVSTSRNPSRSFSSAGPVENHQPSSAEWTTSAPSSTRSSPR